MREHLAPQSSLPAGTSPPPQRGCCLMPLPRGTRSRQAQTDRKQILLPRFYHDVNYYFFFKKRRASHENSEGSRGESRWERRGRSSKGRLGGGGPGPLARPPGPLPRRGGHGDGSWREAQGRKNPLRLRRARPASPTVRRPPSILTACVSVAAVTNRRQLKWLATPHVSPLAVRRSAVRGGPQGRVPP